MELRKLLLIAFIFSGIAALIYELTWIRPLQFLLGSTTYTISIILAAFMFGLALGSWFITKHVDEIKNLPKAYGLMELGIGLYGVLLLSIFNFLPKVYNSLYWLHGNFYVFTFVQFVLIFAVLLIPTTLMGATFPVIAKFYTQEKIGKGIGEIYSANNLAAIIGSFGAGFILIPLLGIKASIIFAGSINLLIGFVIILVSDKKGLAKKIIPIALILFLIFAFIAGISWQLVLRPYQKDRIVGFLFPEHDPLGINYNVTQSKIAIGSGGWFGKGFGQGTQVQLGFLPEAHTDFIFATFVEEWGALGGLFLIVGLGYVVFRIIKIGMMSEENFGRFVSIGTAIMILIQSFLNIGFNLGILPVVGIPLPFLSYGGSHLLTTALLIGIIQNIAKER